jgi:hypothetical protein
LRARSTRSECEFFPLGCARIFHGVIALMIAAATLQADAELSASVATTTSGYSYRGGAYAAVFLAPGVSAAVGSDHFLFEGALAGVIPLRDGAGGVATTLRAGLRFEQVSFTLGVLARLDVTPVPLQLLPSAVVRAHLGEWTLEAAFLDRPVGPLGRTTVAWRGFGIGFVAPLGAEIFATFPLGKFVLRAEVYGARLFNMFWAGLSLSASYAT